MVDPVVSKSSGLEHAFGLSRVCDERLSLVAFKQGSLEKLVLDLLLALIEKVLSQTGLGDESLEGIVRHGGFNPEAGVSGLSS